MIIENIKDIADKIKSDRLPRKKDLSPNKETSSVSFSKSFDFRTRIRVPKWYLQGIIGGPRNELSNLQGIIFPYTPNIHLSYEANFSQKTPTHSNYSINFYQYSKVNEISISGTFTVQNLKEAGILLSTIHLLRSITKMSTGNGTEKFIGGAPPPVCLLTSHGEFMFNKVPVVISNFSHILPADVNYFDISGKNSQYDNFYGPNAGYVPTISTINLTLNYVLSLSEISIYDQKEYLKTDISIANNRGVYL